MTPAARRASVWPTMPCETFLASRASSKPRPRMCEWAPGTKKREILQYFSVKTFLKHNLICYLILCLLFTWCFPNLLFLKVIMLCNLMTTLVITIPELES